MLAAVSEATPLRLIWKSPKVKTGISELHPAGPWACRRKVRATGATAD